jgi:hypothetical protein
MRPEPPMDRDEKDAGTHGQGGDDKEDVRNNTNRGTDADRLEATPLSVGDDAAEDGQDVCRCGRSRSAALLERLQQGHAD